MNDSARAKREVWGYFIHLILDFCVSSPIFFVFEKLFCREQIPSSLLSTEIEDFAQHVFRTSIAKMIEITFK